MKFLFQLSTGICCLLTFQVSLAGLNKPILSESSTLSTLPHNTACLPTATPIPVENYNLQIQQIVKEFNGLLQTGSLKQSETTRKVIRDPSKEEVHFYKVNTPTSQIQQAASNQFNKALIHIGEPPDDVINWNCSCSKMKLITDHKVKSFEQLFEKGCKNHHVVGEDGQHYIKTFHGTASDNWESFEEEGFLPVGDGDMGQGFYAKTTYEQAHMYALAKSRIEKSSQMVIEILVPAEESVMNYHNSDKPNINIMQHFAQICSHKFVFKKAILNRLIAKRIYLSDHSEKTLRSILEYMGIDVAYAEAKLESIRATYQ